MWDSSLIDFATISFLVGPLATNRTNQIRVFSFMVTTLQDALLINLFLLGIIFLIYSAKLRELVLILSDISMRKIR